MSSLLSPSAFRLPRPALVLAGLMAFILLLQQVVDSQRGPGWLTPVVTGSVSELETVFARHDYPWPPTGTVPPLAVTALPPGLGKLPVERKKSLFFRTILPLVLAENARLKTQRSFLKQALADYPNLDASQRERLTSLARHYRVEGGLDRPDSRARLLRRVDIVPPALVLAQAATESAWGGSRFAREANNLFGVWTYKPAEGLLPRQREPGARHFVRIYSTLQAAVRSYLYNINIGDAYLNFRQQRAAMRAEGRPLDATVLANSLSRYSERGEDYVTDIRAMIQNNDLNHLQPLRLAEQE